MSLHLSQKKGATPPQIKECKNQQYRIEKVIFIAEQNGMSATL
jgi:hypothetical protein